MTIAVATEPNTTHLKLYELAYFAWGHIWFLFCEKFKTWVDGRYHGCPQTLMSCIGRCGNDNKLFGVNQTKYLRLPGPVPGQGVA
jgi:hypothetical protein